MRRARHAELEESPGGDSFLDIVANIVGILVLLVVVVGVRAGRQVFTPTQAAAPEQAESLEELHDQYDRVVRDARNDQREIAKLRENVAAAAFESERRALEREEAVLYVTKLRAELDAERDKLEVGDRRSLETHNAIAQTKRSLDRLAREQIALASYEPEPELETVDVAPTPIVNGEADETISFRLQEGRLVYVPVNEIEVELSKKLRPPAITDPTKNVVTRERVGPIENFVGEAVVRWVVKVQGNRVGVRASLSQLLLKETTKLRGETPDAAFDSGGYVASRLGLLDPEDVVVRLIVYADSFDSSHEVAARFRGRGFRVAQSLKSDGNPIGFSSNGYQTLTQ